MVKKNIGAMVIEEDKDIIVKAAKIQRRSIASFVVESSLLRARQILKENSQEAST